MTFEVWLRERGLSESSVEKYSGALDGVMSEWAHLTGLTTAPLSTVRDNTEFEILSEAIQKLDIFVERNARGHSMYGAALNRYSEYLQGFEYGSLAIDIDRIIKRPDIDNSEKSTLVKTRVGQGLFRDNLIRYWGGCAVTGYPDKSLLKASHIKPWRVSNDCERLDHFNGLLLVPNLDTAFDSGLIAFQDLGEVIISTLLKDPQTLGIDHLMSIKTEPSHYPYLDYHRQKVFKE